MSTFAVDVLVVTGMNIEDTITATIHAESNWTKKYCSKLIEAKLLSFTSTNKIINLTPIYISAQCTLYMNS